MLMQLFSVFHVLFRGAMRFSGLPFDHALHSAPVVMGELFHHESGCALLCGTVLFLSAYRRYFLAERDVCT
jgi:hypothetical protein